jgi:GTPase SAR1 family protein
MTTSLLLIGKPHSGKTTFITQLCGRVESTTSAIKLYKPIDDLTSIIESTRALANGDEVKATPTDKNSFLSLPLQVADEKIDLACPDYGGEQINLIIENREVDSKWSKLVIGSNSWILFIKPSDLSSSYDLSNKTIKPEILEGASGETDEYTISDQSFFIELLQVLLHTKEQDAHFLNDTVQLTIVLTCWDEFESSSNPKDELKKRLPLLLSFIESNWASTRVKVLGLSSLGFSLKINENKVKYQELGAENFGYLIHEDGQKDTDISQIITEAL